MNKLTQERIKEVFDYNPNTGIFTRKVLTGPYAKLGPISTEPGNRGYLTLCVDREIFLAHRAAFLYMTGKWPIDQTDHINHNRTDNRWKNLRKVTRSENQRNATKRHDNKSGVTGVVWIRSLQRWEARIGDGKERKYLLRTKDFFEAICVRKAAELEYNYHPNHGAA